MSFNLKFIDKKIRLNFNFNEYELKLYYKCVFRHSNLYKFIFYFFIIRNKNSNYIFRH